MKKESVKQVVAGVLVAAGVAGTATMASSVIGTSATEATAGSCSNTCVTVAIPNAEGVRTVLDGSADAELWPPSEELRTIRISALNERNMECDVTIQDVLQDEQPATSGNGEAIPDAEACSNDGNASTVQLRSDRDENGNGRAYHVRINLNDPSCRRAAKADEVVVAVPIRENEVTLKPDADVANLTPSYTGETLVCAPAAEGDQLASFL